MLQKEIEIKSLDPNFEKLLDKDYLETIKSILDSGKIRLVVIGMDPFPIDSIGIPFCKADWASLRRGTGFHVFSSLLDVDCFDECEPSPKKQAIALAKQGVILLNASYEILKKQTSPEEKRNCLAKGLKFNSEFVEEAANVVCLGRVSFNQLDRKFKNKKKIQFAYHPAARGKSRAKPEWFNYWTKGGLKKSLLLKN